MNEYRLKKAIEYAESCQKTYKLEHIVCKYKPAEEYFNTVLEVLRERLNEVEFPHSPDGIYRLEAKYNQYFFYGEIMNFASDKIVMWNKILNQVIIENYKNIISLTPILKYPDCQI